ncbi:MAG: hypothetical protein RL721_519 [Candidatus Eisenbacteria bacterium]|jgi:pullulanase-type alpha-1,6-glucosidase
MSPRVAFVLLLAFLGPLVTPVLAAPPEGQARIHYHRPKGDYAGWGLHAWEDTPLNVAWTSPLAPTGRDDWGVWWDVPLKPGAKRLGVIVHKGDQKDPGPDQFLDVAKAREVWIVSGRNALETSAVDVTALAAGDLSRARGHWLSRGLLAWPGLPAGSEVRLHVSADATLRLTRDGVTGGESFVLRSEPAGLSSDLRDRFPHLAGTPVFALDPAVASRVEALLKGQCVLSARLPDGSRDATGLQLPGVLDDVYATDAPLGVTWRNGVPSLGVWAPTARRVRLHLFDGPRSEGARVLDMTESRGVWSATGAADWKGRYYLYEVEVYVPSTGRLETSLVTDPYSRALSRNSTRTQIVDLADPALAPAGWSGLRKPALAAPEDAVVYELHVRDFSVSDPTVPDSLKGTYRAFGVEAAGTRHLRSLARAGLTHVHLLPTFDIATVDEDRSTWQGTGDLSRFAPDGEEQQAAVTRVRGRDGFNWGYDPFHYGVPEGSYATRPDGGARLLEFRGMVQALAAMDLRVVMDVVYNHTNAAGLSPIAVLDRIVPGYYHRLNADGAVENSTCCPNTASEHRMMERLMVDDLVHWARDHKVDGFRFDLMGHHMKRNLERARDALNALTLERDGVDGSAIVLYGEGWDFGEVQGGRRGVNATQRNLAGTGIGTFNDRLRDAARGGSPFSDRREQGFASGRFHVPGELDRGGESSRTALLDAADRIKVGLAGNLAAYRFTDRRGNPNTGAGLASTGYTADPQECVNYVEAHDNETLWDKLLYALPLSTSLPDRVRMQVLALSIPALGQGIPFFHAGGELLRTKSLDADSYDSGDWFNKYLPDRSSNGWGMGLPPAEKNRDRWPVIRDRIARRDLAPGRAEIDRTAGAFEDLLAVRRSSPLFRLRTADDVQARVGFLNSGPAQVPGVIVMTLSDALEGAADLDPEWERIVVVFNATPTEQRVTHPAFARHAFELHPRQAAGADAVARTARADRAGSSLVVPALTTAVFVTR